MVAQIRGVIFVFYERFISLCQQRNEKPTALMESIGYTRGLASKWKNSYNSGGNQNRERIFTAVPMLSPP